MKQLQISQEFQFLIPPLEPEDFKKLEQTIISEGCRDSIVVWKDNIIIDGHNRYEICRKHNIEFQVVEQTDFEDATDVILWMINNQLARRNLNTRERVELAYKFQAHEAKKARKRQLAGLAEYYAKVDEQKGKTSSAIAKIAGVSTSTVEHYRAIQKHGTDEQKHRVELDKSSINKVYKEIQLSKLPQKDLKANKAKVQTESLDNSSNNIEVAEDIKKHNFIDAQSIAEVFHQRFADIYLKGTNTPFYFIYEAPLITHEGEIIDKNFVGKQSSFNDARASEVLASCLLKLSDKKCKPETVNVLKNALYSIVNEIRTNYKESQGL